MAISHVARSPLAKLAAAAIGIVAVSLGTPESAAPGPAPVEHVAPEDAAAKSRTVRAYVQTRPGGPRVEAEVRVHESPVDLRSVAAAEAEGLGEEDLVLGLVIEGQAIAYPIRYLAQYEVINDRVGETALAPTW